MLVKRFNLKDIKEYEQDTGISVIELFNDVTDDYNIVELVKLGNVNYDDTKASSAIDEYLDSGKSYGDAYNEIRECLMGKVSLSESDKIDIDKYSSLTEVYTDIGMNLMSVGVSYSEFWGMTTSDMYSVSDSIKIKIQSDMQVQLNMAHVAASMVGAAVWGKLDKEPPKIDLTDKDESVNIEGIGEMDATTFKNVLALEQVLGKMKNK